MERVSVIIPAYNASRFVADAVDSALKQTHVPHEVIVVDDGSTDETSRVISQYGPRVHLVSKANGGVSTARNAGLERATGEWVLFLDADDRLMPNAVANLLTAGRATGGVAFGDIVCVDDRTGKCRPLRRPGLAGLAPRPARALFAGGGLAPSAFLVPAALAVRIGGFDPRFSYSADLHFFLRCGSLVPFTHVPAVVLVYREHDGNMSKKYRTSITDKVDARLAFQIWCRNNRLTPLEAERGEAELVSDLVDSYFYGRQWGLLDVALGVAMERGVSTPRVARVRRLRRLPPWVFALKDRLDLLVGRDLSPNPH